MEFKAPNQKGLTLFELVLTMGLMMAILIVVFMNFRPHELRSRARDEKRLSDLAALDRVINEYRLDNRSLPDADTTLRQSDIVPVGFNNWIQGDFSQYTSVLPVDPLNDNMYHYTYYRSGNSYEVTARMEYYTDVAADDGGSDDALYELGNDLSL